MLTDELLFEAAIQIDKD